MSITTLIFYLLSVMAAGSAIMMLLSKNPVKSILWLIVVFFAISGHYVLLNAQFLAVVNIIVYAGAINDDIQMPNLNLQRITECN